MKTRLFTFFALAWLSGLHSPLSSCHAATFTVTNTLASGAGSLGSAIAQANATPGTNTIAFNILPLDGSVKTIFISSSLNLPMITRSVIIDGYTQDPTHSHTNTLANADDAVLLIELNGTNAPSINGLTFGSGCSGSVVRGLVINNFGSGAIVSQDPSVSGIVIEGNFIGTDPSGKLARGNVRLSGLEAAVKIFNTGSRIGGTSAGARNIISGNVTSGILSGGDNTLIQGNFIGVDATGTSALGNGRDGVDIRGFSGVIGGATVSARNIISGNSNVAVSISSGQNVLVQGNYIGTDVTGTTLLPNNSGVFVGESTNIMIGGSTAVAGTPPGNLITGGAIGVTVFSAHGGFDVRVQGNIITASQSDGVLIASPSARVTVSSNSIYENIAFGIEVQPGANNSQINPVLTSAATGPGKVTLSGSLKSGTNSGYRLEFFSNAACDSTGIGEGQIFLGATNLTTDASGNVTFTIILANPAGHANFAATATDTNGNTSAFSPCLSVSGPCSIACSNIVVSTTPNQCGANVTFFPTTSGNCGSVGCSPSSGAFFLKGTNTVTCRSADGTDCSFTIVVNDTQVPTINCPANIVTNVPCAQSNAVVNYAAPQVTDNCGVASMNCSPASGSLFPLGTTTVTCKATDTSRNTNTCSFTVTLQHTTLPPVAQCRNVTTNANASCQAVVDATAVDNGSFGCGGTITNRILTPPGPYAKGTNAVTLTVVDNQGASNSCSANIIVVDATGPTITCPVNIVTNAPHGQTSMVVSYPAPSGSDNCSGTLTTNCTPASGSLFPLGATTVTCTATDASGNTNRCQFTVTINPTTTLTWNGAGANSYWTNAANWVGNSAPLNGDSLVFPTNAARLVNTNTVGGPTNLASITLKGSNYVIYSPPLTLFSGLTNSSPTFASNRLEAAITLGADQVLRLATAAGTLTLASNLNLSTFHLDVTGIGTLEARGNVTGSAGSHLVMDGSILELEGRANDLPDLDVISGNLVVDGVLAGGLLIEPGGRLQGKGTVPAFTCAGRLQPGGSFSPGRLTVSSGAAVFTSGSAFEVDLFGSTNPGINYDQLKVSSPPDLSGADLFVTPSYSAAVGETFVIITNTGAAPFTTTFPGFPEGSIYVISTPANEFRISYVGGDGNDVTLKRVPLGTAKAPRLTIQLVSTNAVRLLWPTNPLGFNLECNTNVAGSNWLAATPLPTVVGTNNVVTNATSEAAKFYRVRK